jgi:hypothetical protein
MAELKQKSFSQLSGCFGKFIESSPLSPARTIRRIESSAIIQQRKYLLGLSFSDTGCRRRLSGGRSQTSSLCCNTVKSTALVVNGRVLPGTEETRSGYAAGHIFSHGTAASGST